MSSGILGLDSAVGNSKKNCLRGWGSGWGKRFGLFFQAGGWFALTLGVFLGAQVLLTAHLNFSLPATLSNRLHHVVPV